MKAIRTTTKLSNLRLIETERRTFQLWFRSPKGEFYYDLSSNWIGNPDRAMKEAWALEQFANAEGSKKNK
jgi:hypothetical protein